MAPSLDTSSWSWGIQVAGWIGCRGWSSEGWVVVDTETQAQASRWSRAEINVDCAASSTEAGSRVGQSTA